MENGVTDYGELAARKEMIDYQTAKYNIDTILELEMYVGEQKETER